jgi:flagellar M-ring protein FliF
MDRTAPTPGSGADYRHKIEADLLGKVNSTLEPLLGANKFRAGVSVECDYSGGEQSEEIFDPARSVMVSSQRTEDSSGSGTSSGVPGTASTLPRPAAKGATGSKNVARMTESVTYQTSRTVKKMRLPRAAVKCRWRFWWINRSVGSVRRTDTNACLLLAESLKKIRDLVAGNRLPAAGRSTRD